MTKAARVPILVLLLGVLLSPLTGCAPTYVPNTVHNPMLTEKGDVHAGGFLGSNGFDLQAAVAVRDHVGVSADFSYANQEEEEDSDFHRHHFGEVGIGYFTDMDPVGQFEVYGGYGRGQAEAFDTYEFFGSGSVRATGRYNRFFVQPAVGFEAGPLRLNGAVRLVWVDFYEFETSRETVPRDAGVVFYEPALGLSLGTSGVRFGVQAGVSNSFVDPSDVDFDTVPLWLSLGVQFRMNAG